MATNASATSDGAWRTRSDACSAVASASTSRRAPGSSASASAASACFRGSGSSSPRNAVERLGLAVDRAQHVERDHVAGALPDRVERALAVEARQARLLDVAVPAEALERLGHERRGRLAHPVLRDGRGEAPERPALVEGAGEPHRRHGRRLGLEAEVGEHVRHQRLVDELPAERRAVRRVVGRLRHRPSHQRRRAEHAVEPGLHDHLEDRGDAAPLLADERRRRALQRDLGRRVGAVPELVLQALEPNAVALAVLGHARDEEAREPVRRLREHEERVAHRRRAEPLVAVERPRRRRRAARGSCWRGRRSRPGAPSSPSRTGRRPSSTPAGARGRRRARSAAAPTRPRAPARPGAPGRRRRSSRAGSRRRPRPARAS